jgi:thiol-disulfide isomerase/thioredoxin
MMLSILRRLLPVLVLIAVVAAALAIYRHYYVGPVASVQNNASSASLFASSFVDVQGQMQSVKQWQGKVLVVNFWATWCPPCREEMPELSAFYQKHQNNLMVLGVSTDDLAKIQSFAKTSPVAYPLLAGDMQAMDLSAALGNDKGALPYTVVIDQQGKIVATFFGRIDANMLENAISNL